MFVCHRLQNVAEAAGVPHNFFEKVMLGFKSHCPQGHKRTKGFDELRVVFYKMMLWDDFFMHKDTFESRSIFGNKAIKVTYALCGWET